jgi:glycosyltransferase involved in cell wall biosynthesis
VRVLVVTPWYPGEQTPASGLFVYREVKALDIEHEVHVVHLDWQSQPTLREPHDKNYSHLHLQRWNPFSYLRARGAVRRLAAEADVIHTHALTGLLPWLLGRPGGRRPRRPWVHSEHWSALSSPSTLNAAGRLALRVLRPLLRRPDAVIAESSRLADAIQAGGRAEVLLVPCVVPPVNVVTPQGPDELRLIAVGGIIPRKGPLVAVEALHSIVSTGVDARLTWVGDGPLRDSMLELSRKLGVENRLRLTGLLDSAAVAKELDAATMLLLPTEGDNFCVVVAEALMHGRPIVSGARTGAVDYADPRASRFVREQSGSHYAEAVLSLHQAATLSAAEISETVRHRFSPETVAATLTTIYRQVARGGTSTDV